MQSGAFCIHSIEWQNLALAFHMLRFLLRVLMCDFFRRSLPPIQILSQHGLWENKGNSYSTYFWDELSLYTCNQIALTLKGGL